MTAIRLLQGIQRPIPFQIYGSKQLILSRFNGIQRRGSSFKSSIQPMPMGGDRKGPSSGYLRILTSACFGSVCFVLMGNEDVQFRVSNVMNGLCLDYYAVKEMYRYDVPHDLSSWPAVPPEKRLSAVIVNSLVVGAVSGFIRLPMMINVVMVCVMAKYFNQQSPGYMLMGLRAIYVKKEDTESTSGYNGMSSVDQEERARMDYANFVRRQFAFYPMEAAIYAACVGSMTAASIISTVVYGYHIMQFYGKSNRTWLDKWANVQVIDLRAIQLPDGDSQ